MDEGDKIRTFVVRIARTSTGGVRGVVEQVRTGRKEPIQTVEDISRVIAAIVLGEKEGP